MGKEVLVKLTNILKEAEGQMATLEGGAGSTEQVLASVRGSLREFHKAAVTLGVKGLVRVITEMEKFANKAATSPEDLTTLAYALGSLRRGIQDATAESIRAAIMETLEVFGVEPLEVMVARAPSPPKAKKETEGKWIVDRVETQPKEPPPQAPPPPAMAAAKRDDQPKPKVEAQPKPKEEPKEVADLGRYADKLGGKLVVSEDGDGESFKLEFPANSLDKIKVLLSPFDSEGGFAKELAAEDEHLEQVLDAVKDFMASFAEGNLARAQEVLEELAGVQGESELFKEIGALARGLHDLLRGLAESISSELIEIVEDKIPDSGNRLEHVLHLTENAANTTLDHAESVQKRIRDDQEKLDRLERHFAMLKPIGDGAHDRMDESARLVKELRESLEKHSEDVGVILTSQGYQDLTGQIIGKIVNFQKDLEGRLIGLVRSFGVKAGKGAKKKQQDELYGPAHEKKEGAAHSQDDVDAILAEFGF